MTCDLFQNRLLALPSPTEPTAELREHVRTCPGCAAFAAKAVRVEILLAMLPVPNSEGVKGEFAAMIGAEGPVIRTKPVLPSSLSTSGSFRPVGAWLKSLDRRWLGGVAAGVIVTVGLAWYATRPNIDKPEPDVAAKPRHELLSQCVKHNVALTKARTAPERFAVFHEWSNDLGREARDVYKAASREELAQLATLFEKTVQDGLIAQAKQLDDKPMVPAERQELFSKATKRLAATASDVAALAPEAPTDAQPALARIAKAARSASTTLSELATGKRI